MPLDKPVCLVKSHAERLVASITLLLVVMERVLLVVLHQDNLVVGPLLPDFATLVRLVAKVVVHLLAVFVVVQIFVMCLKNVVMATPCVMILQ